MYLAVGEVRTPQRPLCFCCDLRSCLRSPHLRVIALAPFALGHRPGDSRLPGGVVAVSALYSTGFCRNVQQNSTYFYRILQKKIVFCKIERRR